LAEKGLTRVREAFFVPVQILSRLSCIDDLKRYPVAAGRYKASVSRKARSALRSKPLPKLMRDLTVPSGMPRISAIS